MKRAIITSLVVALSLALAGCAACRGDQEPGSGSPPDQSITQLPEPNPRDMAAPAPNAIDEPLMIALAQAKNFHHKADVYLREGELEQAIDSVRQILSIPFPDGAPEAEDVALDARARLAKLMAAQGKTEQAMTVVDQGIADATRRSFFLANLYTAKGEVYEAMANMLDEEEAEAAKTQAREARVNAIKAFDQSIAINRELQKSLMDEGTP